MTAYLILVFLICFIWGITQTDRIVFIIKKRDKSESVFLILSLFAVFFLMAFRGRSVGADTASYSRYFYEMSKVTWHGLFNGQWDNQYFTTEKGFMVLNKFLADIFTDSQVLIVVCSAIYILCMFYFISKWCSNNLLAISALLCVGGYLLAMNAMRQSIAVGFCCIAWSALQEHRYKRMILWLILAISFHTSSIVAILFGLFKILPANRKTISMAGFMTILFSIFGSSVVRIVIRYFPTYNARYGRNTWAISAANGIMIVWVIILLIAIRLVIKTDWKQKENHLVFEIIMLSICYIAVQIVGQSFNGIQRLAMFFQPFLLLLFEEQGKQTKKSMRRCYYAGVVLSMLLLFLRMASGSQYFYIPFWV